MKSIDIETSYEKSAEIPYNMNIIPYYKVAKYNINIIENSYKSLIE